MTEEQLNEAKRELISLMEIGEHCPESIAAVRAAGNLSALVDVLNSFRSNLINKSFPPVEWVRRHFSAHLAEANALGIYIDQRVSIDRPGTVWLFGSCSGEIRSGDVKFRHVIIDGESRINVRTDRWALMHILIKNPSAEVTTEQYGHSKIIIKHVAL